MGPPCYASAIVPLKSDCDGVVVIERATRYQFFDHDAFVFDDTTELPPKKNGSIAEFVGRPQA